MDRDTVIRLLRVSKNKWGTGTPPNGWEWYVMQDKTVILISVSRPQFAIRELNVTETTHINFRCSVVPAAHRREFIPCGKTFNELMQDLKKW